VPAPAVIDQPPLLTFPCVGDAKQWHLTQHHVNEWSAAFPGIDVMKECLKALAWCNANPEKRKTARGMTKFLFRWLCNENDRGGGNKGQPAPQNRYQSKTDQQAEYILSQAREAGIFNKPTTPPLEALEG
jgi:hypothetical protein